MCREGRYVTASQHSQLHIWGNIFGDLEKASFAVAPKACLSVELAESIGKSLAYITKLEANERKGTVDVLSDIATALRVDLGQLI